MSQIPELQVVKAVCCDIPLGESVLDAYMLPNGEKRIGIENTGVALGYSTDFFFLRTKKQPKALKALQDNGFSGEQIWVKIIKDGQDQKNSPQSKTISMRDFVKLVTYEAIFQRNKKAMLLLAAFAETGLERILEDAFAGRSIEFLLEKIVHYTKWTNEELEQVLQYNREELLALYPWNGRDLTERKNPDFE